MDGSFKLGPYSIFGTDVMSLSKVCNSTGWRLDGFTGGGDDGAVKLGIGVSWAGA